MKKLKVALIEDDLDLLNEYRKYIDSFEEMECLTAVSSAENFLKHINRFSDLDLILMDFNLPGMSGIKAIPKIKFKLNDTKIVMLTSFSDDETIFRAFRSGAVGYLVKGFTRNELKKQLLTILEDGAPISPEVARVIVHYFNPPKTLFSLGRKDSDLTAMEKMVLHYLMKGLSYQEISEQMDVTINSVRYHIKNIYRKLQVNSRNKLIDKYKNFFAA